MSFSYRFDLEKPLTTQLCCIVSCGARSDTLELLFAKLLNNTEVSEQRVEAGFRTMSWSQK